MTTLAWGARVSGEFRARVVRMAERLGLDASWLMAIMAFETGRTFSPSIRNPLSKFVGLIQFGPAAASDLNTSMDALAAMDAVEQLDYVERYFARYRGRMRTLSDAYMAVLWPKAIGQSEDAVIFYPESKAYLQNRGLDLNHDGAVTKAEAAQFVTKMLAEGLRPENCSPALVFQEATKEPAKMDPISLIGMLASVFAPLIRGKVEKAVGTEVGKPLVDNLLGMAQELTGKTDPLEAVAVARQDPAMVQTLEQTAEDWFSQMKPALDVLASLEKQEADLTEQSLSNAAGRNERAAQEPLSKNPAFLVAIMVLGLVAVVVFSVLWKDVIAASFGMKEIAGFSTDMQSFVIGAIVGSSLTAVLQYVFGTNRQSAAKDVLIGEMARRQK